MSSAGGARLQVPGYRLQEVPGYRQVHFKGSHVNVKHSSSQVSNLSKHLKGRIDSLSVG